MFMNFYCYMIFFPMIIISNFLILISSSWISMWMIMEFNSMTFLMMMIFNKNMKYEITMIFFLIQSFNSYLFLMSSMNFFFFKFMNLIIWFSLISKMGIPPFYLWYIKIMSNLNWMNFFIMSSLQKIIPLIIMTNLMNMTKEKNFMFYSLNLCLSILFSSFMFMNFSSLKIILTFSSIIQISWIILLMMSNEMLSMMFLFIYSTIMMNLSFMLNKFNLNFLNNINSMKFNNSKNFFMMNFLMFSLSSTPPFTGFLMKWLSIQEFFSSLNFFLIILLIFSAIISSFIYIRMIFINIIINSYSMKMNFKNINLKNSSNFSFFLLNWISISYLFIYEIF
uniref:NADH-ubiquinone oxidoreductase chain 2 n=1 Tax=Anastatus dexingensis TaxID=2926466 RepID=A0A9E8YCL9_9HYME|nr:NADH dehydrogenase subunit 2 [Anastatus dexingensis]WAJ57481.1 NADH dehydrogenase subunit 2 [Anastatus dexingensis]